MGRSKGTRLKRDLLIVLGLCAAIGAILFIVSRVVSPQLQARYGDPEAFAFLNTDPLTDEPVRYNPCEALPYVVNLKHAPPGELEDVQRAMRMTSEASGIEFLYEGETSESPTARRPLYQPRRYGRRWAPILIGWLPQRELGRTISFEHPAGRGGSGYARNEDGELVYVSGQVVLNADADLDAGFGPGNNWGDVLLHEVGHLMGLAHVDDRFQIMYRYIQDDSTEWGPGDRNGLRRLGREAGCLTPPPVPENS